MAHRPFVRPALFICDIQEKFRPVIHAYPQVIATARKLIKASEILSIPIHATTQSASKLGPLCADLELPTSVTPVDKTKFSMVVGSVQDALVPGKVPCDVAIVGIETHICVTQTALDLLGMGHRVYIIADGVSSCNAGEIPVALRRLEREGARVVTSEGWLYECMGDANVEGFRSIAGLVKETKESTKKAVEILCKI